MDIKRKITEFEEELNPFGLKYDDAIKEGFGDQGYYLENVF
ncbi:hypothetical protein [uncultured Ilyobacter sp.]|nr:hypothetical protein [uncultured Ilyobacter sp.]